MQPVLSAAQMREIDRLTVAEFNIPSLLLMEAAADACLRTLASRFGDGLVEKKALILCGPGNNGGDGAAIARGLARIGVHTDVVLLAKVDSTKGDARINFEAVERLASFKAGSNTQPESVSFFECDSVSLWEEIAPTRRAYDIVVDALFGTGLTRPLSGLPLKVVQHLALLRHAREDASDIRPLILSVDIPSGLNADLAEPIGESVSADLTVTFTAPKAANVLPPAAHLCGHLVVANIGSPAALIEKTNPKLFVTEAKDARAWLQETRYTPDSYKNTHGHLVVVAGARGFTGAAALCGNAAMRSGAGLVTIATPASAQTSVAAHAIPEVMTAALAETDRGAVSDEAVDHFLQLSSKASVVAIGPGLTAFDERTRTFVRNAVERRTTPVVLDADGLNCLSPWPDSLRGSTTAPLVLTPHPGEMLRLLGTTDRSSLADRVSAIRDFATSHEVILVLKGSRSLIAAPDGRVFVNPTGNPGLGTAGAGDTLTGIISGFLAQAFAGSANEPDAVMTTVAALYVSGLAGDLAAAKLGMRSMVASDVRNHLSEAIVLLDPEGEIPQRK
jgi:ADP-dependent NAD(P)H-hydrate dehydratase / NAD(P)H-hydrate epimerase